MDPETFSTENFVKCLLCKETYKDARLLPCVHSFCIDCLCSSTDANTSNGLPSQCPLCKKEFKVTDEGLKGLRKDPLIEKLVTFKTLTSSMSPDKYCEECYEDKTGDSLSVTGPPKAECYCINCSQYLCRSCGVGHGKNKLSRTHGLVKFGSSHAVVSEHFVSSSSVNSCIEHKESMIRYCVNCRRLVCATCLVNRHLQHQLLPVTKAAEGLRGELRGFIAGASNLASSTENGIRKIQNETIEFTRKSEDCERTISSAIDDLKRLVDTAGKALLAELRQLKQRRLGERQTALANLQHRLGSIEHFAKYCTGLDEIASPNDLCEVFETLNNRFDELQAANVLPTDGKSDEFEIVLERNKEVFRSEENIIRKLKEIRRTPSDHRKSDDARDGFEGMDLDIEVQEKKEKEKRSRWSDRSEQEMNDGGENSGESSRRNKKVEQKRNLSDKSDSERFTFFWRPESPFSQHHPANFVLNGNRYNCAVQYMMHMKAVVFRDERIAYEIMSTTNPARQTSLAKHVNGFDDTHWNTLRRDVVKSANIEKFSQNPRLRRMLLATAGTTMVEANPVDNTWGIGLNAEDPKAWRKSTWAGLNLLGEILTEVREELTMKTFTDSDDDNFDNGRNFQRSGSGESYTIFWRPVSPFHPKYPIGFVADGVEYWTLLQYIVHQKALFFGDVRTAREALENIRPTKLEEIGRKVRNYDHPKWSRFCRSFLVRGNFAKFSQNANVRQQLIDNIQSGELVYSVEDRLLGIGLNEDDPRVNRKKSWKGKNLLGQSLMEVREMILDNKTEPPEIVEIEADEADEEETSENIFFFFTKSPFSQWHRCSFKAKGLHFTCAEQYMLHQCALHFNDHAVAAEIMNRRNARDMQNLYPQNYNELEWNKVCRDVIKAGNYAKFSQDFGLRNELMRTEDAVIAYSAENDTQLGIGLRDSDSRAWNRRNWPGRNLLGEVLMEVRNELKQEKGTMRSNSNATDRSISQENIASLPLYGKISDVKEEFHFISAPDNLLHPLHKHDFKVEGLKFNCIQQFVIRQKLEQYNGRKHLSDLMKTDPLQLKKFEDSLKLIIDPSIWPEEQKEATKRAYLEKSLHLKALHDLLCDTKRIVLVYADPKDPHLGIGLPSNDPNARSRRSWKGKNLLGEWLKEVQEEMPPFEERSGSGDRESWRQQTSIIVQDQQTESKRSGDVSVRNNSTDVGQLKEGVLYIIERMPLNAWFPCSFKADGFEYNSVGQYLYHQKALMLKDEENAGEIMESKSLNRATRCAKRIRVEEGCENQWNSVLRNVLKNGNYHKFSQNEALKDELLASSGKSLAFADSDKVLGIGLKPNDPNLKDQSKWTGENLLGSVLMELREDFVQGRAVAVSPKAT